MNPLELFADNRVSDLLINSTAPFQIDVAGQLQITKHNFTTEQETKLFAKELVRLANTRIDIAKPYAEGNIETEYGAIRIHCILGDECSQGTQISLRRHPKQQLSLEQLVLDGFVTESQQSQLMDILFQKKNFVIIGATGSGKTTLLRAMLQVVTAERIVCIEDSAELNLTEAVSLYSRSANHEGQGEITLAQLLREALRMRPDRLVVGEARGEEIAVLLQALNTGHSGAGFTLHANSISEAVPRMLTMLAQKEIQPSLGRMMINSAIDYVIELQRTPQRSIRAIEKLVV